jgi:hypothetical protein
MTGARSRDKGKRGELEACALLRRWFPNVERNLTETREGQGIDLTDTAPFGVQVKRYAKVTPGVVLAAWSEAVTGVDNFTGPEVKYPVVLHRSDRQPWQLTIEKVDLVNIYCGNAPRTGVLGTFDAEAFFESWNANGRPA